MKYNCKHFLIVLILTPLLWRGAGGEFYAQTNLVPNWSFEIDSLCPDAFGEIDYAPPWHSASWGSPDYFNACSGSTILGVGVPLSYSGFQIAKTGSAYAGIYGYVSNGSFNDLKEYLKVKLTDSLIYNRKYCVSFYVNLAKPPFGTLTYNNVGITEIGIFLSDTAVFSLNQGPLPFMPQIVSPVGVFLIDTLNWTEISGTYTAHGGEKYITIGNFKPTGMTDTLGIVHHNSYSASYYFVDDVTVRDCTNDGVGEETNDESISLYPNPASNSITIEQKHTMKNAQFEIKDVLGQLVYSSIITTTISSIDISTFPSGIYFLSVQDDEKSINRKFVKG